MSTPELEQAIAAARWRGVEANFTEALAKMLDVSPAVIARVVYAWETLKSQRLTHPLDNQLEDLHGELRYGGDIPGETRIALEHAITRAFKRMAIRWRMERNLAVEVSFDKLVPADRPDRICDGCTWQLECVRDSLSTPQKCLHGAYIRAREQPDAKRTRAFQHRFAAVKVVKLDDVVVTVTAEHPRGTFTVSVMDVLL